MLLAPAEQQQGMQKGLGQVEEQRRQHSSQQSGEPAADAGLQQLHQLGTEAEAEEDGGGHADQEEGLLLELHDNPSYLAAGPSSFDEEAGLRQLAGMG